MPAPLKQRPKGTLQIGLLLLLLLLFLLFSVSMFADLCSTMCNLFRQNEWISLTVRALWKMGKGDRSVGNSGSAPHGETVRSRHFSSNGLTSPPATTLQLRKPRCPNGFSIPWFPRSQGKYAVTEKKEKEMSWQLRSSVVLMILLLTNLINYMDRYTIAGVYTFAYFTWRSDRWHGVCFLQSCQAINSLIALIARYFFKSGR